MYSNIVISMYYYCRLYNEPLATKLEGFTLLSVNCFHLNTNIHILGEFFSPWPSEVSVDESG